MHMCFPGGSDGKESACKAGDLGLMPGSGRSPGEGNGYPFQYPGLGHKESDMTEWLGPHTHSAMTGVLIRKGEMGGDMRRGHVS